MELDLQNKIVLVTGASQGIGEATAEAFAEEGASLHLAARSGQRLRDLAARLKDAHGVTVEVHEADLGAPGASEKLAQAAGDIDILVNNAGAIPFGSLDNVDERHWREAWDLKVFGYINLSRIYHARMCKAGRGVILLVAGLAGEKPNAGYIAGTAGNAALMAFGRALGSRSLDHGVRVITINPGSILTNRINDYFRSRALSLYGDENRWTEVMADAGLPGGRCGTGRELADVAVFLASARASYVSGTVVTVDGGLASG